MVGVGGLGGGFGGGARDGFRGSLCRFRDLFEKRCRMVTTRALEQLCEPVSGLHGLRNVEWIMECSRNMECKDYEMRIAMPSLGSAQALD